MFHRETVETFQTVVRSLEDLLARYPQHPRQRVLRAMIELAEIEADIANLPEEPDEDARQ